jgi:hypothetical protein
MVTIRPIDISEMSPTRRCQLFSKVRNKLGVFARGRYLPVTFAWSRESNPDGTGEHMHVLIYMPKRHREKFDELVTGWFPGPGEADVITATQKVRFTLGWKATHGNWLSRQADDAPSLVQAGPNPEERRPDRREAQWHNPRY